MYAFEYRRPTSLADAVARLAETEDSRPLSGGMTLLPTLKQRLAQPTELVDLSAVPELKGVREEGDALVVGAFTRHVDVATDERVRARIPALASLAESIGDRQVRNRGTLGGSVANADPAADYPAAVLGLGATVVTDRREVAGDQFFTALFETALEPGELVTAVRFPVPQAAGYAKFRHPASRYALVGVFVARVGGGVRVAVTGAGPCVFRVPAMEAALAADFRPEALAGITIEADGLNGDIHASPEYRAHLVTVMAKRAVAACG